MSANLVYYNSRHTMLERALAGGSLTPVFQPLVRVDTFEVVAHEGLSRCAFMPGMPMYRAGRPPSIVAT